MALHVTHTVCDATGLVHKYESVLDANGDPDEVVSVLDDFLIALKLNYPQDLGSTTSGCF